MENLGLVSSPKIVFRISQYPRNSEISSKPFVGLPNLLNKTGTNDRNPKPSSSFSVLSLFQAPKATEIIVSEKLGKNCFASIASSSGQVTYSVGANPQLSMPPHPSHVGSPFFRIGVGVCLSALFSWVADRAKVTGGPSSDSSRTSTPMLSQAATVDVPATKVEKPPSVPVEDNAEPYKGPKKYAFVDVSLEETFQKNAFESYKEFIQTDSTKNSQSFQPVSQNGMTTKQEAGASEGKTKPLLSVEALEKMMEDPIVQKMVYLCLPEEMRNPSTLKWMLQNLHYRQQLQDMLNNMGGSAEWDNHMMDSLKNFDLNSPRIKQQFCQIGLTPEEVISKIMANSDVAMAFQNPRVQAAIMDVMDVFTKISELFPGVTGS